MNYCWFFLLKIDHNFVLKILKFPEAEDANNAPLFGCTLRAVTVPFLFPCDENAKNYSLNSYSLSEL